MKIVIAFVNVTSTIVIYMMCKDNEVNRMGTALDLKAKGCFKSAQGSRFSTCKEFINSNALRMMLQ